MGVVTMEVMGSREEWLARRKTHIGGSDAAAILGINPWLDNVTLWKIKTGQKKQADIADNAAVKFGTEAEKYIRGIYALAFPQFKVDYVENNIWFNTDYPFAHVSLDGYLTDQDGRRGVLEIKTTNILQSMQNEKWRDNHIPDNYYAQLCHAMAITEFQFSELFALLRYDYGGETTFKLRRYHFERSDCEEDIAFLMEQEREFAKLIVTKTPPARKLPEI
jgi:putative phage-type endonuclease